ncbi:unnamed protein product [Arctia plantaginis]|uniref:Tetraspanin n=1 Tax=Arctia plantaginis TaxID=874455 RepID=A0A8S1A118_ARCPL|nr:unnamed protein product [Arctia plantaginis]
MRVLAVAKIAPSFVLLVQTLQLRQTVENYVNRAFDDPSMSRAVQFLETLLKCCGTSGPEAYINLDGIPPELPPTCCDVQDNGTSCLIEDAYQRGCATLIGEAVQTWSTYLGYLFMIIIAGEVVKLTVASYVIRAIKEKLLRD